MANEVVELHPASFFDCPSCGRENFIRHIMIDIEDEARDPKTPITSEFDPEGVTAFWEVPKTVKCQFCKAEFPNQDYIDTVSRAEEEDIFDLGDEDEDDDLQE